MKNRKIIDLFHYGDSHELKFFLGDDADVLNCDGNNWDDIYSLSDPVYRKFIKGTFTIDFNYNTIVKQPLYDTHHSRNDFKNRLYPCLAIIPPKYASDYKSYDFNKLVKLGRKPNSPIILVYFGDGIADVYKRLRENNTIINIQRRSKTRRVHADDEYYDPEAMPDKISRYNLMRGIDW